MGDLARDHMTLVRNGEGYLLQARHASFVNGKPVVDQAVLHDGDIIRLGATVELEFRQPSPVSATARLSILSRHRLPVAVDGILLMAETCIVGEANQAQFQPRLSRTQSSCTARLVLCGAGPSAPSTSTAEPMRLALRSRCSPVSWATGFRLVWNLWELIRCNKRTSRGGSSPPVEVNVT